jgi:hypothetical protein
MREMHAYFSYTGTLQGIPPCVAFFGVEHVHFLYSNFQPVFCCLSASPYSATKHRQSVPIRVVSAFCEFYNYISNKNSEQMTDPEASGTATAPAGERYPVAWAGTIYSTVAGATRPLGLETGTTITLV